MALRKTTKEAKKNAYIEVDGIENKYLDAALLHSVDEEKIYGITLDELKILKKAGVTVAEVKKKTIDEVELKNRISPYILENYNFYNLLVNNWHENGNPQTDVINFEEISESLSPQVINDILDREDVLVHTVINFLRFYKNGEYKSLISLIFSEESNLLKLYEETGIKVERENINWDKKKLTEVNDLDNDSNPDKRDKTGDRIFSSKEALTFAAGLITDVAAELSKFEEKDTINELYEVEKETNEKLINENKEISKEVKSKNTQIKSFEKEKQRNEKTIGKLNEKIDIQQKEIGKMGLQIGEYRVTIENTEKNNQSLKSQIETLNKDKKKNEEKIKKDIIQENNLKSLKMQVNFDEKTKGYEQKIYDLEKRIKELEEYNSNLSESLENNIFELNKVKSDFFELEEENMKIKEKLNSKEMSVVEPSVDEEIDFSEEDLGAFIGFDNKPTQN